MLPSPQMPVDAQNAPIFGLPSELTESIVVLLAEYPVAIAAFAQTCRHFRSLVYATADDHLWRNLFLALHDDPRRAYRAVPPSPLVKWGEEYQRRVRAYNYFRREQMLYSRIPEHYADPSAVLAFEALQTLHSMIDTTTPHPPAAGVAPQPCEESLIKAHYRAPNFSPHPFDLKEPTKTMLMYRNIVYYGIPINLVRELHRETNHATPELHKLIAFSGLHTCRTDEELPEPSLTESVPITLLVGRPKVTNVNLVAFKQHMLFEAKRTVYNMDYPTKDRLYGPFCRVSGRRSTNSCDHYPHWKHLAAVRLVVQEAMVEEFANEGPEFPMTEPMALRSRWVTLPSIPTPLSENSPSNLSSERDWAGVTGLWRRLVTWYGYGSLLDLNDTDFDEVVMGNVFEIRTCVPVRLRVVGYIHDDGSPADFPTIKTEEGRVSMLSDGSVRWTTWSYTDASKRKRQWVSEGVQIGGIGSTAGAIGMWTGASHEDGDPIGAWWQWRVE
ncbi:hypothetical protein EUX98_g6865 [Antrodiella citrinella]|uniref:F-box domain-containing protein n=1 Tax=Antrodiella citrinella TaxID=2447956 RepID=A0A4S4MMY5_9APHY|nr:hypothetical protein EUX98_g6865 [Antrodiella citrinella]